MRAAHAWPLVRFREGLEVRTDLAFVVVVVDDDAREPLGEQRSHARAQLG
ncbi:hypothetical protein WMF37_49430 [Sorangium sp. So ce291]